MRKINTQDKRFHDGNGRDVLGTIVTADWLNAVQDELVGLIEGLGEQVNGDTPNQIAQALQAKLNALQNTKAPASHTHTISHITGLQEALNSKLSAASLTDASTSQKGVVRLSSQINSDSETLAATPKAVKQAFDRAVAAEGKAVPAGTVMFFASPNAPAGWLKANGAAVSRSTYANLFAAIGTTFGAGNGSTTFNLPDLRGEFIRGFDDGRNVDSGRGLGTSQGDAIRNITGKFQAVVKGHATEQTVGQPDGAFNISRHYNPSQGANSSQNDWAREYMFDASSIVPTAHENRPRNVALLACIKI